MGRPWPPEHQSQRAADGGGPRRAVAFWRELSVLGSRGLVPDDIRDAIDLYLDGTLDVRHLVDSVRPLEEANAALEDLKAGRVFRSVLAPT